MINEEFFGNDKQRALMRRAKHLWAVVGDDPRMSFYGRSVSLATAGPDDLELKISLARLQGITTCMYVRREDADALKTPLETEGLVVNGFETLRGGPETLEDRRGERIAMTLGAMAILQMHERHGVSAFTAGVRKGNSASENLCAKLAIVPSGYVVLSVVDPVVFGDDRMSPSSRGS